MNIHSNKNKLCLLLTTLLLLAGQLQAQDSDGPSAKPKPNIIVINLDDADPEMLSPQTMSNYFPNLKRFSDDGIRFTNFHVTTPLCGPSRAAFFTAKYSHKNGIRSNDPFASRSNGFEGGMTVYGQNGHHQQDVSTWMKSAGYRTMMIGKYLHGDLANIVPSGWDDFNASLGANYYATARFTNKEVAGGKYANEDESTYRTTIEADEMLGLIETHAARKNEQPFFLYLAPLAPHHHTPHDPNGMVERKYLDFWRDTLMPLNIDHLEADFSDKSTAIRDVPNMNERQAGRLNKMYRDRMLSMKSVDDLFARLTEKLSELKLSESTYIILTSDNGFSLGHHRMIGKGDSFNRSTHVPTYVLGPGVSKGAEANHLLAHIDLAPTIVELGGGSVPDDVDGKSFVDLLTRSSEVYERSWRKGILIENWENRNLQDKVFNTASLSYRMYDSVYVEWANGSPEFYDLTTDPYQVENSWESVPPERRLELANRLHDIRKSADQTVTSITRPFMEPVNSRKLPFIGMADSNNGVDQVQLGIRRFSDFKFWNGHNWQVDPVSVDATITNPGQQVTTWSYANLPTGDLADELMELSATAIDAEGRRDESPPYRLFRFDYSRPECTILQPENGAEVQPTFHVKGLATDDVSVDHLQMLVRNVSDKRYWTGQGWSVERSPIQVPVRSNGRFGFGYPDLQGNYRVSIWAVDSSGNTQATPTVFRIGVVHEEE